MTAPGDAGDVTSRAPRTGILIVRLWWEAGALDGVRAHVTHTLDSAGTDQTMTAAGGAEGLYAEVRSWVEEFVATGPSASSDR